jgi:hypothetical protein
MQVGRAAAEPIPFGRAAGRLRVSPSADPTPVAPALRPRTARTPPATARQDAPAQ